ncbi:MAG: cytochrome c biogenesis protein CcsA [Phycisphaerales bacterium]|nr:cytochrome c biogenesis protein CcsA [Phycisphaerales bacterium]
MMRWLTIVSLLLAATPVLAADEAWLETFRAIPVQDGGRVMPLDTYANSLAVDLTGRKRWSASRGPEAFAGRDAIALLADLMFNPSGFAEGGAMHTPLIAVENRPCKKRVGLDPATKFFGAMELAQNKVIKDVLGEFEARRARDQSANPVGDERIALDLSNAVHRLNQFVSRTPIPIVPRGDERYLHASESGGEPGTEAVQAALRAFGESYRAGQPLDGPATTLALAIEAAGRVTDQHAKGIGLELFYNDHKPWRMTAYAYTLAIIVFGLSRLVLRKPLVILAVALGVWGVAEHTLGFGLRWNILHRVPASNTYESLLWMGLIAIVLGLIAQIFNRKAYYLLAGVCAAVISVLFAMLVPLDSQTNALPAVLRSNFWLVVHVLTIVASYGCLLVASVLGHAYLIRTAILGQRQEPEPGEVIPRAHPLTVQNYRCLQIGLFLLTAGTILGGVWAADSWGRFWGWDPKETWALISIVIYFIVLHARHVNWIGDFGLAASSVLSFAAIVWTFYGVNYVMATGLHSYGFGSGGEIWVALWAIGEVVFLVVCKVRQNALDRGRRGAENSLPITGKASEA